MYLSATHSRIIVQSLYHRAGICLVLHMECIKTQLQKIIMIQINSIITDCFPTVRRRDLEPDAYLNPALSGLFDDTLSTSDSTDLCEVFISMILFYLVTENGISSYDMTDGYKLQNMLAWK